MKSPHRSAPSPRPTAPAGFAARRLAVDGLDRILHHNTTLEDAFDTAPAGLDPRDRAMAYRIVATALRRAGTLRTAFTRLMARGFPKSAPRLEAVLMAGATQLLFMDVPDHAAVGLSVDIARADRTTAGFAGLVNAVLRRIASDKTAALEGIDPFTADTPAWLRTRWIAAYGEETARALAAMHRHPLHVGTGGEQVRHLGFAFLRLQRAGGIDDERVPVTAADVEGIAPFITPQGDVRTLPHHWMRGEAERSGLDGFFATRLRRIG